MQDKYRERRDQECQTFVDKSRKTSAWQRIGIIGYRDAAKDVTYVLLKDRLGKSKMRLFRPPDANLI